MEEERWVPIKGFEGKYEISDHGNVKSLKRIGMSRTRNLTPLQVSNGKKYRGIELWGNGITKRFVMIHRLVAEHFLNKPEKAQCVHHKDGNPSNNHVSNLEWCTHHQNMKYDFASGARSLAGEKNSNHKLTACDVETIRFMKKAFPQLTKAEIARAYGVTDTAIRLILNGKRWK